VKKIPALEAVVVLHRIDVQEEPGVFLGLFHFNVRLIDIVPVAEQFFPRSHVPLPQFDLTWRLIHKHPPVASLHLLRLYNAYQIEAKPHRRHSVRYRKLMAGSRGVGIATRRGA
jgi:hypothetical protein